MADDKRSLETIRMAHTLVRDDAHRVAALHAALGRAQAAYGVEGSKLCADIARAHKGAAKYAKSVADPAAKREASRLLSEIRAQHKTVCPIRGHR